MHSIVRLEPQKPDHAPGLFDALRDPRIYRYLDEDPPQSVEAVKNRIERLMKGGPSDGSERWLNWSVFDNETIVGYTQATITDRDRASIAYVFSPKVWGQGVAYRAVRLMLDDLQATSEVATFVADTETGNIASQRLLKRLQFKEVRTAQNNLFYELKTS